MVTLTPEQSKERDFMRYRESVLIDEQTWVAENLDAPLEKPLEYRFVHDELWSEQGQALGKIFKDSIDHYEKLALLNPNLSFLARRSRAEYCEYETMLAMARGEAKNTMVVITPLPRELEGATDDVFGYQVTRRLGFIRVISYEGGGRIKMWTHSFDMSDPEGIEAIYRSFGRTVDWGRDVLEQPITLSINSADERELVGDKVLYAYDDVLERRYGGKWQAGRDTGKDHREAITFVNQQRDLLEAHVDALIHIGAKSSIAEQLRYDFAAAMRRRFEGNDHHRDASDGSVANEMASAGHEAAEKGEEASGCGLTISANQVTSAAQLEAAGYKPALSEMMIDKCMECPRCRQRGVLVEVNNKGKTDYTCANKNGCGASTKSPQAKKRVHSRATSHPASTSTESKKNNINQAMPFLRKASQQKASKPPQVQHEIIIGGVREVTN